MEQKKDIMARETVLPEDFDGTFKFTNPTEEEFVGVWNKKEYHFPPMSTSPMIIPEHSLLEIQWIRKKFARDLAEREFGKTQQYNDFLKRERNIDGSPRAQGMSHAATYTISDLTPMIQKCLTALPKGKISVKKVIETPLEEKLTRDEEGKTNTKAVRQGASMRDLESDFNK